MCYSYLVANVQDMFELIAHAMMLGGEEGRVEDDAQRDRRFEKHVVDDDEEEVLEAQPQLVVDAVAPAAGTVSITGASL